MEKLISVIIPVYNGEKTIARCLESIIKQSYQNLEIIVVNDGSKDRTLQICEKYANEDDRIIIINKDNEGPSKARNLALDNATGSFVMFADCDDYVEENWCKELYEAISTNKASLALCTYYEISDKEKRRCRDAYSKTYTRFSYSLEICHNPISYYHGVLWNKIYRNTIIRRKGIRFEEDLQFGEDFAFNLKYLEKSNKIVSIDKPLYNYVSSTTDSLSRYRKEIYKRVDERVELFTRYVDYWKSIKLYRYVKPMIDAYIVQFYLSELKRTSKLFNANELDEYEKYKEYIYNACIVTNDISTLTISLFKMYKNVRNIYWDIKNYGISECIHARNINKKRAKLKEEVKKILLYCDTVENEKTILEYFTIVKDIENAEFSLYYNNPAYDKYDNSNANDNEKALFMSAYCDNTGLKNKDNTFKSRAKAMAESMNITLIDEEAIVRNTIWSVCVTAGYGIPDSINSRNTPIMCISPNISNICADGASIPHIYDYSVTGEEKQIPRFTDILVPNRRYASVISGKYEVFIGVPHFTGLKFSEELYNNSNYEKCREELSNIGIDKSNKVVLINYSLKSIDNVVTDIDKLVHYIFGLESIDETFVKTLKMNGLTLVLNFECYEHNNDYELELQVATLINKYRKLGVIVRRLGESVIPYIIASDEVYTNGSNVAELALFADKNVMIYGDIGCIWNKSNLYDYIEGNTLAKRKCVSEMIVFKKEYNDNLVKLLRERLAKC